MIRKNLELLFQNYMNNFAYFDDPKGGYETYKWIAMEQVQKVWSLDAANLSEMIKDAFSKTYNLINNRIVSPGNGLSLLAKEEPDAVRKALSNLLSSTSDTDEKQDKVLSFVDEINGLLEKHFPGKWKYTQDVRVAITYLALIKPEENYLFKSTPAHTFARYMGYETDIGSGANFKLRYYYQMCDELREAVEVCPELLQLDSTRNCVWKDDSHHLLTTDLIYCFGVYPVMRKGFHEPAPRSKRKNDTQSQAERGNRIAELQEKLESLQDQMDTIENEIAVLPAISLIGQQVKTKAFGLAAIDKQEGEYLTLIASGKERRFALPFCVADGFIILDDAQITDRYRKEAELLKQLQQLSTEQRSVNIELQKY